MSTTSSKRSVGSIVGRMRAPRAYDGPITVDVEVVTPELAAEWLTTNTHNRNLNRSRVNRYVDYMKRDQWRDGVADIAFDVDGVLQNGQHTLSAIAASNKPAVCTVKRSMSIAAQMITDTGRGRKLSDELQMRGLTNAGVTAAAVKQYPVWIHCGTFAGGNSGDGNTQRNAAVGTDNGARNDIDLAAYCVANREFLNAHAKVAKSRAGDTPTLTASNLMVLAIVFNHFAGDYGDRFMAQLCNEVDECAQPIRKYQSALLAQAGKKSIWHNNFKYVFAVKALNAYMARIEIKALSWKSNELAPTIDVPEGATA